MGIETEIWSGRYERRTISRMPHAATTFSKPSLLRTLVFVAAAIVMLSFLDIYLARRERSESLTEAKRSYDAGQSFMKQGKNDRAVDEFRAALVVDRENPEYQLALSLALVSGGRFSDAEAELNDLLAHDGTAGAPNLAMARVLVKEGRVEEALSFYHRAIYGHWKQNALARRVDVRFELIDLLVSRNEKEGLLAELLPLQEEAPDDPATKMKLASLFISAGSPARGADLFHAVLRINPKDADAYAGLGDAEFARTNYRSALQYYETALRLRAANDHARRRVEICNQILALDPTQRALRIEEQYKRSVKLPRVGHPRRPAVPGRSSHGLRTLSRSAGNTGSCRGGAQATRARRASACGGRGEPGSSRQTLAGPEGRMQWLRGAHRRESVPGAESAGPIAPLAEALLDFPPERHETSQFRTVNSGGNRT